MASGAALRDIAVLGPMILKTILDNVQEAIITSPTLEVAPLINEVFELYPELHDELDRQLSQTAAATPFEAQGLPLLPPPSIHVDHWYQPSSAGPTAMATGFDANEPYIGETNNTKKFERVPLPDQPTRSKDSSVELQSSVALPTLQRLDSMPFLASQNFSQQDAAEELKEDRDCYGLTETYASCPQANVLSSAQELSTFATPELIERALKPKLWEEDTRPPIGYPPWRFTSEHPPAAIGFDPTSQESGQDSEGTLASRPKKRMRKTAAMTTIKTSQPA